MPMSAVRITSMMGQVIQNDAGAKRTIPAATRPAKRWAKFHCSRLKYQRAASLSRMVATTQAHTTSGARKRMGL